MRANILKQAGGQEELSREDFKSRARVLQHFPSVAFLLPKSCIQELPKQKQAVKNKETRTFSPVLRYLKYLNCLTDN